MNHDEVKILDIYHISPGEISGWTTTYDYVDYVIVCTEHSKAAFVKPHFKPMKYLENHGYARFIHNGILVDFKTKKEAEEFIEQRRLYEL